MQTSKLIDPLVCGCPILTSIEYEERHDRIGPTFIGKYINIMKYWIVKNGVNTKNQ